MRKFLYPAEPVEKFWRTIYSPDRILKSSLVFSCVDILSMAPPYAFVSLLTSDSYLPGALTLAAALRDTHTSPALPPEVDFETVCLVTPETVDVASIKLLRKAFDVVVGVEIIEEDNERGLQLLGMCSSTWLIYNLSSVLWSTSTVRRPLVGFASVGRCAVCCNFHVAYTSHQFARCVPHFPPSLASLVLYYNLV